MPRVSVITPVRASKDVDVDWLIACAKSVSEQSFEDWEMLIVNDHSPVSLSRAGEAIEELPGKFRGMASPGHGVSAARNHGVQEAEGELIFPLDADDLLPKNALQLLVRNWDRRNKNEDIVYGDTLVFGQDFQRLHKSGPYGFKRLLKRLFIPVGCLHTRQHSIDVGGWDEDMQIGLEDWEYWIRMGEAGHCGKYVEQTTYKYRKTSHGRLAALKSKSDVWNVAYQKMRDKHLDSYAGRFPVGCCGKRISVRQKRTALQNNFLDTTADDDLVLVTYIGPRQATFHMRGQRTGTVYKVSGTGNPIQTPDGRLGVAPSDLHIFQKLKAFRVGS